jgi:hypothetical protein
MIQIMKWPVDDLDTAGSRSDPRPASSTAGREGDQGPGFFMDNDDYPRNWVKRLRDNMFGQWPVRALVAKPSP